MRKFLLALIALAFINTGCAWLGFGDDSETTAETITEEPKVEETAPVKEAETKAAPAKKEAVQNTVAKKTTAKAARGSKSESQIKAELDKMGHKLAAQSARTLLPNKANKEVKQRGGQWVATYIEVDPTQVTTELRPGANGQYVGFIRYQEKIMECHGNTRQQALTANCSHVRSRNLNELIRYDGHEWQD